MTNINEIEKVTATDIAKFLGCSTRNVTDRITKKPTFPKARKIGQRRYWLKNEFNEWFLGQVEK